MAYIQKHWTDRVPRKRLRISGRLQLVFGIYRDYDRYRENGVPISIELGLLKMTDMPPPEGTFLIKRYYKGFHRKWRLR